MRHVVTRADGFLGQQLNAAFLKRDNLSDHSSVVSSVAHILAVDRIERNAFQNGRGISATGDISGLSTFPGRWSDLSYETKPDRKQSNR